MWIYLPHFFSEIGTILLDFGDPFLISHDPPNHQLDGGYENRERDECRVLENKQFGLYDRQKDDNYLSDRVESIP
jgi:hypothetical protein